MKRIPSSLKKYKKQKNYCSKLYKKESKAYFDEANPKKVSDIFGKIYNLYSQKIGKLGKREPLLMKMKILYLKNI